MRAGARLGTNATPILQILLGWTAPDGIAVPE
jgi:hypothetical protein